MIAIISLFNSDFILGLIYKADIVSSNDSFRLLMFSFIGMCSTILFGTLLTAKGDLKFLNIVAGIGIVINVAINIYLIPLYGATGAAIATLITQTLVSLIQFGYSIKTLQIEFSLLVFGQFTLFIASLLVLCYFVRAESVLVFCTLLVVSLFAMILFRLIDLKALKGILKSSSEEELQPLQNKMVFS